jgi:hypothetical protein
MNHALRKRDFNISPIKGYLYSLTQLTGYIPLLNGLSFAQYLDYDGRITKVVNPKELGSLYDVFFPNRI